VGLGAWRHKLPFLADIRTDLFP
ncbi:MAG: hypothetical protein JWO31_880, partial [Phycisphaerales bacterium]|nr:hypothetical protein [Phycisphaerales bacterium]